MDAIANVGFHDETSFFQHQQKWKTATYLEVITTKMSRSGGDNGNARAVKKKGKKKPDCNEQSGLVVFGSGCQGVSF